LTRARLVLGDRRLGRRLRRLLRRLVYGAPLPAVQVKEIADVRTRMEIELGKETPGRRHVKFGRGGLVDVEFLVQTLQLRHGATSPGVRAPGTLSALRQLARVGALEGATATALASHYRFLRRLSAALRLLSVRPADTIDLAGPVPARVASALGYPSREAVLEEYGQRTAAVRALYAEAMA
jgi:glutamate-ammonia-ligase adenylyltransferase